MVGILLALQVNNWNEWKKDRKKEQKILFQIENNIEATLNYLPWQSESDKGNVLPIEKKRLPKNALSTESIHIMVNNGRKYTVCGKVVSTKKHEKGHVFINLDQKFPNQVLSISIFESNINNFS